MLKRILATVLVFVTVIGLLPVLPVSNMTAEAATTVSADKVANYLNGLVGTSYASGMCLNFVANCWKNLGFTRSSTCCAYNYGSSYIDSTSSSNIPIGADVFFGSCGGGPCGSCGASYYGHIGIYVGDGYFVHATGGTVQKTKLSSTYWSSRYRGWGWHGNVSVTDSSTPTPVDLGTDFCAVILNKNYWKPIKNTGNNSVSLQTETGSARDIWYFERQSDGSYKISSCYDKQCLDLLGASTEKGALVGTYENNNSNAQRWYFYEESGGYIIRSKHSMDYVLDLADNSSADGTIIQMWEKNNTSAQIWSVYKCDSNQLQPTTLNVTPGTSATATTFTWNTTYGAKNFDLKIWDGTVWDGEPDFVVLGTESGVGINLPAGTYQGYVDARHEYNFKMSNIVTFTVPKALSLDISTSSLTVKSGNSSTVNVNFSGDNIKTLNWKTSDSEVCTATWGDTNWDTGVSSLTVNGKKAGTATITVSLLDSNKNCLSSKSFTVTVSPGDYSITFSQSSPTIVAGKTATVNVSFSGGYIYGVTKGGSADSSICTTSWTSTNFDTRTVTVTITGVGPGTTTIPFSIRDADEHVAYVKYITVTVVPSTYTVSFNANGGTGAPSNQTKVYGTDITLSSAKPIKSYTITYNANGGSVSPASKTVSATFNNWKATDGTVYKPGASYTANSGTTLTAQWTNPTAGALATPTRTGYTFDGWYTAASGGTKVTSSTTITGNITLYAHWSKITTTTTTTTTTTKATTTTTTKKPTTTTTTTTKAPTTTTTKKPTTTTTTTTKAPTTTTTTKKPTTATTTTKAPTTTTTTKKPTTTTTTTKKPTTTTTTTTKATTTTTTKAPTTTTTTKKPTTTTTTTTKATTTTTTTKKPTTTTTTTTTAKPTTTTTTKKPTTTSTTTTTTKATTTTTTKPTVISEGVVRIAGGSRTQTAVAISKKAFSKTTTVILADGNGYADSLAGVPLAYALDAPILLVRNSNLDADTKAEIQRLGAKKVIILGGELAINNDVVTTLKNMGINVERIAGKSRFDTAVEIAKKLEQVTGKKPTEVFFAYSHNYADALSIGGVAAVKKAPILYIAANGVLSDGTKTYLQSSGAKTATILGGTLAVSADAEGNIKKAGATTVSRVFGKSRYATCIEINKKFESVLTGSAVCVATGTNFPDALAGGVFAAKNNAPLVLVPTKLTDVQTDYIKAEAPASIYIFGGATAVSSEIENQLKSYIKK